MGIRANTQNAVFGNLPWFDREMAFDMMALPPAYRPSAEELARTRLEVSHFIEANGVTHCPTRYATITQACVPPRLPPKPLQRARVRPLRRRAR